MSKRHNKSLFLFLFILSFVGISACSEGSSDGNRIGDTTFLDSGVKYIYLSQGNGRQVESGSHVVSNINLIVNGDTIWSTYAPNPQEFGFDAKKTSLISGFDEVVMYAKEGDRILAIIPPELGYGAEGSGVVPPNAILHFDIDFLKVDEPKVFLRDLVADMLEEGRIDDAIAEYERVKEDTANYNASISEWYTLHRNAMQENEYERAVRLWEYRLAQSWEGRGYFFMAQAFDSLGQVDKAISVLESGIETATEDTNTQYLTRYLDALKAR